MVAVPLTPLLPAPIVDPQTGHATPAFIQVLNLLVQRIGGEPEATILTNLGGAVSVDNSVARFNGTTGESIQDSGVLIDDADKITAPAGLDLTGLLDMTGDLDVLGDIILTGVVDGRDVAADGIKLDGVEALAEVNDVASVFGRVGTVGAVRGDYRGGDITRGLEVFETTVGQAALASAGTVILLNAAAGEQWKVRELWLSGAGTNFSGGGGDRLLDIKEGTTIYSTIPAATLQALAAARWGDAGLPFPATAAHLTTATAVGADIVAQYSGGTADYTAGSLTIVLVAERVT